MRADGDTLACLSERIGAEGGQVARLAHGEALTFEEANASFLPFVGCASDAAFSAVIVPTAMHLFGQNADAACIESNATALGNADRAAALALALTQPTGFAQQLSNYFVTCAY